MDTSKGKPDALARCQQQMSELSAEIVRLQQENDRLIHDLADPSRSLEQARSQELQSLNTEL